MQSPESRHPGAKVSDFYNVLRFSISDVCSVEKAIGSIVNIYNRGKVL